MHIFIRKMRMNVCGKSPHLKKCSRDGFHQDDGESMRLLFKVLSETQCRLFKLKACHYKDNGNVKVILISDDKCAIFAIFFNESNCTGSSCKHCRVAKDKGTPLTIIIDLLKGANSHTATEKGLKLNASAIIEEEKMDDVNILF